MIISYKYKYLFVESPNTGSTAISAELQQLYDGRSILKKHSRYFEFVNSVGKKNASKFFVFSSVRNPLDAQVSIYYKYKNNHRQRYTNPAELIENGGAVTKTDLYRYHYIQEHNLSFIGYLKKFVNFPYDTWSRLSHKNFDFVIRYENIQADFSTVLKKIGIIQQRPLPLVNPTKKENTYLELFDASNFRLAADTFGSFMKKWNYEFPPQWGTLEPSQMAFIKFEIIGFFKSIYWRLRPKSSREMRLQLRKEFEEKILKL
ncbi:MAG: sulfotransferase family 2 domain-containing protein [Ignavibacteriales bacterium]|nr:sulfotransferase family 2 domain-containing protein [Ignavibacteriales bacterium]